MTEKCKLEGCQIEKTGVCALHGVEVERRKGLQELSENIPKLLTTVNRLIGWSILMTILVLGGYTFTLIVKNDLDKDCDKTQTEIGQIKEETTKLQKLASDNQRRQTEFLEKQAKNNDKLLRFIKAYHQEEIPGNLEYHDVAPDLELH